MQSKKGDKRMSSVLNKKYAELDVGKLKARAEVLKTNDDGSVLLHKDDPEHVEWFEDDED
ncbi:hypothetical protein [Alicyclobacillus dauci]|uniref:Uncharacterized protein n=1 Tax=Alicyclobacillus dauci TaxID=1475485 RepID=A0ABY6Z0K7_9BACL|nr:hypothetical protein [Alicyclobacillus dauci]WAH36346.1 hypothetical protein NZD86_19280 [Alicyclobacillus dauci]WAH39387.1 hypothetical protein NZD86_23780 [Alicyclobacillus dauci]